MKTHPFQFAYVVAGLLMLSTCIGEKGSTDKMLTELQNDTLVEEMNHEGIAAAGFGTISRSKSAPDSLIHYGSISIEKRGRGQDAVDFWENGLTDLKYHIYRNDSLLTEIDIERSDFTNFYVQDFAVRARIWDSEILAVDSLREKVVIYNKFGLPESDNETFVLCVADFDGDKLYLDSPFASASGTNISFNMIVNCNGVYDFGAPVFEFSDCCTVYSDLVNARTLFYVIDWEKDDDMNNDNAFLIDIFSKDTLERFRFDGFSYELGYTALIAQDKDMGILALFDPEQMELTCWDSLLKKDVYDVTSLRTVSDLKPGDRTIEMYSYPPGQVVFEFDEEFRPVAWNQ